MDSDIDVNKKTRIVQILRELQEEQRLIDIENNHIVPAKEENTHTMTEENNENMIHKHIGNAQSKSERKPSLERILRNSRSSESESSDTASRAVHHHNRTRVEGVPFVLPAEIGIPNTRISPVSGRNQLKHVSVICILKK